MEKEYTLIIWTMIPEDNHIYLIPNDEISYKEKTLIEDADGKFVNVNNKENDGSEFLNIAFGFAYGPMENMPKDHPYRSYAEHYEKYEVKGKFSQRVIVTRIINSGIVL
jgi:hypothetical protein